MNYKNLFFMLCITLNAMPAANELQKVYYTVKGTNQVADLELGNLVLYFSQEPIVKVIDSKNPDQKNVLFEQTYFIPGSVIATQEVKDMIKKLSVDNPHYTISISAVKSPAQGVVIKIGVDPKKVLIQTKVFDVITGAKALEFRIFNKTLLDAIKQKGQSVLRVTHHKKPRIIIDCGHGGKDTGALGFYNAIEKNITLAMGNELAKELRAKGFTVSMTRTSDCFIALDERTTQANKIPGQTILVSLHANSAPNKAVHGLETFCLSPELFKKTTSGLQTAIDVLIDQSDCARYKMSEQLAQSVHKSVLHSIQEAGYVMPDRKVRHKATMLLVGTTMPGILLEMEYLSNEYSAGLFQNNSHYSKVMVTGIVKGILDYTGKNSYL